MSLCLCVKIFSCIMLVICEQCRFQSQFRNRFGKFIRSRCGGAFDPVAVLHPRLEHTTSLVAARAVGVFVVEDEMPPRTIHGPAVDRAGERAEALGRLEQTVSVELVGEELGRKDRSASS